MICLMIWYTSSFLTDLSILILARRIDYADTSVYLVGAFVILPALIILIRWRLWGSLFADILGVSGGM